MATHRETEPHAVPSAAARSRIPSTIRRRPPFLLLLLFALLLPASACEEKTALFFVPAVVPPATIQGTVTLDGEPAEGVTVTLSGDASGSVETSGGSYAFEGLGPGTYTVTVTPPAGTSCTPTSHDVTLEAGDAETEDFACESSVPGTSEVTGTTTTSYDADPEQTTCSPVPEPFEAGPATIEDTGTTEDGLPVIQVVFPDVPEGGEIRGTYDPSLGTFEGETGEVDLGNGLTAVERWMVTFAFEGSEVIYSGVSEVTFTDSESGASCVIVYDIVGTVAAS